MDTLLQRTQTLLKEYKERDKSNVFIDKRFGEYNSSISAEEKMMRRFALEQQVRRQWRAACTFTCAPAGTCLLVQRVGLESWAQAGEAGGEGPAADTAGGSIRQPEGSAGLCPRVFTKALAPARVGGQRVAGGQGRGMCLTR